MPTFSFFQFKLHAHSCILLCTPDGNKIFLHLNLSVDRMDKVSLNAVLSSVYPTVNTGMLMRGKNPMNKIT